MARTKTCDGCGQPGMYLRRTNSADPYLYDPKTQQAHYLTCPSATPAQRKEAKRVQDSIDAARTKVGMLSSEIKRLRTENAELRAELERMRILDVSGSRSRNQSKGEKRCYPFDIASPKPSSTK